MTYPPPSHVHPARLRDRPTKSSGALINQATTRQNPIIGTRLCLFYTRLPLVARHQLRATGVASDPAGVVEAEVSAAEEEQD